MAKQQGNNTYNKDRNFILPYKQILFRGSFEGQIDYEDVIIIVVFVPIKVSSI